jgi:hypothetical protein
VTKSFLICGVQPANQFVLAHCIITIQRFERSLLSVEEDRRAPSGAGQQSCTLRNTGHCTHTAAQAGRQLLLQAVWHLKTCLDPVSQSVLVPVVLPVR